MPTLFLDSGSFNHIQVSGSLMLSGSTTLQGTSSFAITASHALNAGSGTPGGSNTTIQFNRIGAFSGSNNFTFNSASNQVQLTGSLIIKSSSVGGIDTVNSYLYDNSNNIVVHWNGYSLIQPTTQVSTLDWASGLLRDPSTDEVAIDWDSRILQDEGAVIALTFSDVNLSNGVRLYGTSSFALTASYALSSQGGTGDTTAVEAQFWFLL